MMIGPGMERTTITMMMTTGNMIMVLMMIGIPMTGQQVMMIEIGMGMTTNKMILIGQVKIETLKVEIMDMTMIGGKRSSLSNIEQAKLILKLFE
jgi:hypothetical protein